MGISLLLTFLISQSQGISQSNNNSDMPKSQNNTTISRQNSPRSTDKKDEISFYFNTLLYAANSVADKEQKKILEKYLLNTTKDNYLDSLYPIRIGLKEEVSKLSNNLKQKSLMFFLTYPTAVTNYNALVLQLVGPAPSFFQESIPNFKSEAENLIAQHSGDLQSLLQMLYKEDAQLWLRHQKQWQNAQISIHEVDVLKNELKTFLHSQNEPSEKVFRVSGDIMINPLMPRSAGVTMIYDDGSYVSIIGPTISINHRDMLIVHEMLHPYINDLFKNQHTLANALKGSSCVFEKLSRDQESGIAKMVYGNWKSYISESIIRSISSKMSHFSDRSLELGVDFDKVLTHYQPETQYFSDTLTDYLLSLKNTYCKSQAS